MKKYLAIFDLDGTLFDTRGVNQAAYAQALEERGFSLGFDYFCAHCDGRHASEFLPEIISSGDRALLKEIHGRKKELYGGYLDRSVINAHLFRIIEGLSGCYNIALATTASRQNAMQLLEHHGKSGVFDLIVTQEDVKRVKPDPECFLQAMRYFHAAAGDTIIFEDSQAGVEAAVKSGASVCRVLNMAGGEL